MKHPRSVAEAIEHWSPVTIAWALDRGLLLHTPWQLTRAGWAWMKRGRARENGMTFENGGRPP